MVRTMPREDEFRCGEDWVQHSPTGAIWRVGYDLIDWEVMDCGRLGAMDQGRDYRAFDLIQMAERVWHNHCSKQRPPEGTPVRRPAI